ncbi:hypothetical protein HUJ04_005183 [Dendroctonus ponderosae]|nr:hypothetical protein HUJ04_005183 [Dendroctonus ponderosae]
MTDNAVKFFVGNIIHCPAKLQTELIENGYVAVLKNQEACSEYAIDFASLDSQLCNTVALHLLAAID